MRRDFVLSFCLVLVGLGCFAWTYHLYQRSEILGPILGTIHNLAWFQRLMSDLREAITAGCGLEFRKSCREKGFFSDRPPAGE